LANHRSLIVDGLVGEFADGAGALGQALEDGPARSVAERAPASTFR